MTEHNAALISATPSPTVERSGLPDGMRQLAYAWVGLWGVAAEDLGKFYQRCVARGEQLLNAQPPAAHAEAQPLARDVAVTPPKTAASRPIRPMSVFNAFGAVESYHIDLNAEGILPTKQELDALSERVEALAREVDALMKQREQ